MNLTVRAEARVERAAGLVAGKRKAVAALTRARAGDDDLAVGPKGDCVDGPVSCAHLRRHLSARAEGSVEPPVGPVSHEGKRAAELVRRAVDERGAPGDDLPVGLERHRERGTPLADAGRDISAWVEGGVEAAVGLVTGK